ncbi:signal transduction histidine kinase [Herbihabitans rhizosphaerae]|uniref:histidine kinase n=1 Tax=Herbihabitans rhizosphaerae TaxID=1872711 RepID=A0A4Q7KM84_9PSEU|nr:sensor domain-containing protein [Herbihabitans rhizosphaerae]RZS37010.1 signal transduction histidine kinase [Herbihabitans rhizosphaerae]
MPQWREFKGPLWTLFHGVEALVLAVTAIAVVAPLLVLTFVGFGLIPIAGSGFPLLALGIMGTRWLARRHRTWASNVLGIKIENPYRPLPSGPVGRLKTVIADPATWRDILWLPVNATVGAFLAFTQFALSFPVLIGMWANPKLRWVQARITRSLLAPTESAKLTARVEQLASSRAETVDASAAELRRIERDLHDGAQARLVALGMNLGMAEDAIDRDPTMARDMLIEARQSTTKALVELRDLVRGIHPPVLADRGLDGGVQALALDCALTVDVDIELEGRAPAPVESAAYFAVSEVLTNAAKHSGAGHAWIHVRHTEGSLQMQVVDNGHGGADLDAGTGLRGIQRRLAAFDGTLVLTSPPGGPTVVSMSVPCVLSAGPRS